MYCTKLEIIENAILTDKLSKSYMSSTNVIKQYIELTARSALTNLQCKQLSL